MGYGLMKVGYFDTIATQVMLFYIYGLLVCGLVLFNVCGFDISIDFGPYCKSPYLYLGVCV